MGLVGGFGGLQVIGGAGGVVEGPAIGVVGVGYAGDVGVVAGVAVGVANVVKGCSVEDVVCVLADVAGCDGCFKVGKGNLEGGGGGVIGGDEIRMCTSTAPASRTILMILRDVVPRTMESSMSTTRLPLRLSLTGLSLTFTPK